MGKTEATARPWHVFDGPFPGIEGPRGVTIVVYGDNEEEDQCGVRTGLADAALIVRAVNTFDKARECIRAYAQMTGGDGELARQVLKEMEDEHTKD